MRALVLAGLVSLAGCIIDNDRVRVESFAAETPATFTYGGETNTVITANDDGAAERFRREWLAEALNANAMCSAGYVVEIRQLLDPPDAPSSNAHDVVYTGRCL